MVIRFAPGSHGRKMIKKTKKDDLEKAICEYVGNKFDGRKMDDNANIMDFDGVYLITDGEYVKIGVANNIIDRIRKLQTGNAKKLVVLVYQKCPNAYSIEKALHKKYKQYKVSGEWYDILNQVDAGLTIQNLLL